MNNKTRITVYLIIFCTFLLFACRDLPEFNDPNNEIPQIELEKITYTAHAKAQEFIERISTKIGVIKECDPENTWFSYFMDPANEINSSTKL